MERTTCARCFKEACKLGATAIMLLNTVGVTQVTNFGVKLNMHLLNTPYRDPPASETSRSRRLSAHHACVHVPRLVVKHQADGHQWEPSITCKPTQVDTTFFMSIITQHNATLQFKLRKLNVTLGILHGYSKFDSSPHEPIRSPTRHTNFRTHWSSKKLAASTPKRLKLQDSYTLRSNHVRNLGNVECWNFRFSTWIDRISVLLRSNATLHRTANSLLHHPRHSRALCFCGLPNPPAASVCLTNCKVTDSDWISL